MSTIVAPKFRTTARLCQWVRRNKPQARLSSESERCFLKSKESPERISSNLLAYASHVGELGDELESLVLENDIHGYVSRVVRRGGSAKESVLGRITNQIRLSGVASSVGRLPASQEARITEPPAILNYAQHIGPVPETMENLLVSCPDSTFGYLEILVRHGREPFPEKLLRALVGHDKNFIKLASRMGGRLPPYLEESISTPMVALDYARRFLKGRLPEKVECVMASDVEVAVSYAFDVVRAYASPRLPDVLHNAVVMSPSGTDNSMIRQYIREVERTSKEPA